MSKLQPLCASPDMTLFDVAERINQNRRGIVLVTDPEGRLLDTVTDGDLRRAVLAGLDLHKPVSVLQQRRTTRPVTAPVSTGRAELIRILKRSRLRHLPLLDAQGRVQDLALLEELLASDPTLKESASDLQGLCVSPADTLLQVTERINQNRRGIALVTDREGRLLDTVTDGDLRRAVLAGWDLHQPVSVLQERRTAPPITALMGTGRAELIRTLENAKLRHLPLLDEQGRVQDLVLLEELLASQDQLELSAVVMAGGLGLRLRPLTTETPKPMLPVGDKPLLERTVEQLRDAGIQSIYLATNYKSEVVSRHFGDGNSFGVHVRYLNEDKPRGTAGALALLPASQQPLLVMNGDILTRVNYRALLAFHRENQADLTMGVRRYELSVPYGVVETDGVQVSRLAEKPRQRLFVNAGVYLLEPELCRLVPTDRRFDMTDLIAALVGAGKRVVAFPISEYWLDIGQPEDYAQAQQDVRNGRA